MMRDIEILQKVRSNPEIVTEALKATRPSLTLDTMQKARAGLGQILTNAKPSTEESAAVEKVLNMLQPKRRLDDTELAMFTKFRDGTREDQEVIRDLLVKMSILAREEQPDVGLVQHAPHTQKKRGRLGGLFF